MADQAQAELFIRLRAAGVGEASQELMGLARSAVNAGKEFRTLQGEAGAGLYRKIRAEAQQSTAELERFRRVLRDGRLSVFAQDVGAALAPAGRVGTAAFAALTAGVGGFVTAGMQGTAESINLHRALQQINYDVASIFTPAIHRGIDAVQRLSDHLRGLTGAQQASAREWVAGALALSGFLALAGRLGGGAGRLPGLGSLPLVGGLVGGLGPAGGVLALVGASQEGRAALVALAKATVPVTTLFSQLAAGVARLVAWLATHLPGGPSGPLAQVGTGALLGGALGGPRGALAGAGLAAAGTGNPLVAGGVGGAAGFGLAAGALGAGGGLLYGAIPGIVAGLVAAEINKQVAGRVENQTDVAELRRRLADIQADRAAAREGPFGGPLTRHGEVLEREIRARIKELEAGKPKEALTPFAPGFETPADLYRRIAEVASADTSKSAAEQTADNTKQMADALRAIREAVAKLGLNAPLDRPGDD